MKNTLAISCFFLSGVAGLIYEVAWIRRASLVFGSTTWALSTVLAVFFGGLALGSWLFGRWGQHVRRPIRLYGLLELGLGALALVSLWAFGAVDGLYGVVYRAAARVVTDSTGLQWLTIGGQLVAVRVLLVALVLLPPTILMGATLPLFCRQFIHDRGRVVQDLGFLYGINTLGAVLGTLLAGFVLMPRVGVSGAVFCAVAIDVLLGVTAVSLRLPALPQASAVETNVSAQPGTMKGAARRVIPALFFTSGLVVVGAEIFWSRFLSLVIRDSVTTYTVTLAVVLAGIVLGSLLVGLWEKTGQLARASLPLVFGVLQMGSALAVLTLMSLPASLWFGLGHGVGPFFLLLLPATVLSGASFPLANRLVLANPEYAAARVGWMTALNTVGGIVGSLLVGFWVLPRLGLGDGVRLLTVVGVVAGIVALIFLEPVTGRARRLRWGLGLTGLLLWLGVVGLGNTQLPADFLGRKGQLLDFTEGHSATLSAVDVDGLVQLDIDNLWQGIDQKGHQIMAAHLPALLHPAPRDVLVIGVGVGQTAGRFLEHGITSLDCVDVEPDIFPFIDRNFPNSWLRDPRVTLVAEDGRTFTAHTDRRYDIISVEVGQTFRPGVDVFYTREFYQDARAHLRDGGLLAQFVPLGFLPRESFRSVVATFLAVFPDAGLWYNTQELLLIGGTEARPRLNMERLRALARAREGSAAKLAADMAWSQWGGERYHLNHPGALLGSFLADAEGLQVMSAGAPLYSDDVPRLAYETSGADILDRNEEPMARFLGDHLARLEDGASGAVAPAESALAAETRRLNLRDIVAAGLISQVAWGQTDVPVQTNLGLLAKALKLNPESYLATMNMGKLLLLSGQAPQAEPYLARAVAMRPQSVPALRDLGMAFLVTKRPQQAVPVLQRAVRLDPAEFGVRNYLGSALAMTGDPRGAVIQFEKALALRPDDEAVQQNLARARREAAR